MAVAARLRQTSTLLQAHPAVRAVKVMVRRSDRVAKPAWRDGRCAIAIAALAYRAGQSS
jgi:hypothetical protein